MSKIITIDPVTRIEGHLKIKIEVDETDDVSFVKKAYCSGTMFRGMERLLNGRDPYDAPVITSRICGVCPVPHSIASVLALDSAFDAQIPENGRILRNIVLACNFLWSHILHFYTLTIQDYAAGPNMAPWRPISNEDIRFNDSENQVLCDHYVQAFGMIRKANELCAIFAGKSPHSSAIVSGGFTGVPTNSDINDAMVLANELNDFITNIYNSDAQLLGEKYSDYFEIGQGHGNLLSFGSYNLDNSGQDVLFSQGIAFRDNSSIEPLDANKITEDIASSFYTGDSGPVHPFDSNAVNSYPKADAYSWTKSPRYDGNAVEVGPLARMWVSGKYNNGISVLDRHLARAMEAKLLIDSISEWLGQISVGKTSYIQPVSQESAEGFSLTEAPRGSLGHWIKIQNGKISNYQIVTPTCFNTSPRDSNGIAGPLEKAIEGTKIDSKDEPVEVLRIIHSYDPCQACAVH